MKGNIMEQTTLICNKFSGINRSSAVFSNSVITASDLQNVELFSTEINSGVGIRTMNGNASVCDLIPEGEEVINIFESTQKSQVYFFVHTESLTEGKIYLFIPSSGELILKKGGLSVSGKSSGTDVAQGWSDLWIFSNSIEMVSIEISQDGEDDIQLMELVDMDGRKVKGLGLVVYAGRLWVFDGQVLWYSAQENVYDFETSDSDLVTSAGYIEFVKKITAIYPYLGSLAVFHKNSSCMIAQDDDQSFYKSYESPGGCAGYNALVFHGTQLYFYDDTKKGVFSFLQVVNGDKTLGDNIALDIQNELFSIPSEKLDGIKTLSVVTSERNEVWFLIPNIDENYSTILIYDYLRGAWVKRKSQKISSIGIIDNTFYSAGKKIYAEYVSGNFDGEFIESYFKCTPLNLGVENSLKILAYPPKMTMDMHYSNDFYVEYTKDYNSLTTKIRHIICKTLKNVLYFDTGFWDSGIFMPDKISAIKKLPASYFKTLQMSFYTKEDGQNFSINSIEFGKIKVKS
jgi:hypothetical protein